MAVSGTWAVATWSPWPTCDRGFGKQPGTYHSDVIFLKAALSARRAMGVVDLREGVDQWSGPGVLYFARLSARRTQSRMGRIVGTPEYQQMTIRSWTTTTKVLALIDSHRTSPPLSVSSLAE